MPVIKLTRISSSTVVLDETNISKFELTTACCGCDELTIGNACSSRLIITTISLPNTDESNFVAKEKYKFEHDTDTDYYYITSIKKKTVKNSVIFTITLDDVMSLLTMPFANYIIETKSVGLWILRIQSFLRNSYGIILNSDSSWDEYATVTVSSADFPEGATVRELVGYLAGLIGRTAVIKSGELSAHRYHLMGPTYTGDEVYINSEEIENPYTIRNLRILTSDGYINTNASASESDTLCIINPLIKDLAGLQAVSTRAGDIIGRQVYSGSIKIHPHGNIFSPGVSINYTPYTGKQYLLMANKVTTVYDGAMSCYIESFLPSSQQSTFDTEVGGGGAGGTEPGGGGGGGTFSGNAEDVTYDSTISPHTEYSVAEELSNLKSAEYIDYDDEAETHTEGSVAEAIANLQEQVQIILDMLVGLEEIIGTGVI